MNEKKAQILEAVRSFGHRFDPEVIGLMRQLIGPMHDLRAIESLQIQRDLTYGSHPRQRLDVYGSTGKKRPALLYVHGGGFTAGDKRSPDGAPFYQNVGLWANQRDMVGVAMTYRLAPEFKWPAGAEDIGRALAYLHANADSLGIDTQQIVLMGQSAGAVHAANYLSQPTLHSVLGGGICACILVSGLYDMVAAQANPPKAAYFAEDPVLQAGQSALPGLLDCKVPLMIAVNEFDMPDFEHQTHLFVSAYLDRYGHLPWLSHIKGHNHISSVLALGLREDALGAEMDSFFSRYLKAN
jgi:pimeloyl-ACP methyl ester carboxylesterase